MDFLGKQTDSSRGFQNCKVFLTLIFLLLFSGVFDTVVEAHVPQGFNNSNRSGIFGIELPENLSSGIASSSASAPCRFGNEGEDDERESLMADSVKQSVKLHLKKRSTSRANEPKESITESAVRDLARIQTLHTRIAERKNQDTTSRLKKSNVEQRNAAEAEAVSPAASPESHTDYFSGQLMATLESGVSLGSGEYFIDVFVGSPPRHFSLILDTGSDLNWIQCVPCYDCFEQNGPYYDPRDSISFRNITCNDPRCQLVSSPDPPQPCKFETQSCPYFYWYGDSSNTTGDFAIETFTVNLTSSKTGKSEFRRVENVMFGCGHWNRGLFHGAAGLLGLGRGPLFLIAASIALRAFLLLLSRRSKQRYQRKQQADFRRRQRSIISSRTEFHISDRRKGKSSRYILLPTNQIDLRWRRETSNPGGELEPLSRWHRRNNHRFRHNSQLFLRSCLPDHQGSILEESERL